MTVLSRGRRPEEGAWIEANLKFGGAGLLKLRDSGEPGTGNSSMQSTEHFHSDYLVMPRHSVSSRKLVT